MAIPVPPAVVPYLPVGAGAVALVAIVVAIIALAEIGRLRRRLKRLQETSVPGTLERLLEEQGVLLERLREEGRTLETRVRGAERDLRASLRRLGIVRYNAFQGTGANLSFSIALLSDEGDGFVLTGLYGREETRVFAKPVTAGDSSYPLSDEEREAIAMAREGRR